MRNVKNDKGQALLFIILAMTVALTVGVSLTSRTITAFKGSSSTDTSSRAFAAAEGGIEWFLTQPLSVLENLSDGDSASGAQCPSGATGEGTGECVVTYLPQNSDIRTDPISSKANVAVSKFRFNDPTGTSYYWFNLSPGDTKEVYLEEGFSGVYYLGNLDICWESLEPTQSSLLYIIMYNTGVSQSKGILQPRGTINGTVNVTGATSSLTSRPGYTDCYNYNISTNTRNMRFRTLYAPAKIALFPAAAGFPTQGYKLVSKGQIINAAEQVVIKREITAYRSYSYVPAPFDYSIYSQGPIN